MTVLLALVMLGPLVVVGASMTDDIQGLGERLRTTIQGSLEPPDFLEDVPLIGHPLTERWRELTADGKLTDEARQHLRTAIHWLLGVGAALGGGIAQLALSIFCTFFFYRDGEAALRRLADVLEHVGGERAHHLLTVAHGTLKAVVYGVIGAALAQATLAACGYWLSGVPAPFLLGLATGFVGIIPGGTAIIWLPAAIWLFASEQTLWGVILALWSVVVVSNIDNVIRPLFVARGSPLPVLLVLIGILGGAMAFGFIGIFLGPTILATLYSLMREWSPGNESRQPTEREAAPTLPEAAVVDRSTSNDPALR
jgi:predicted PurR-regulated permease PerM